MHLRTPRPPNLSLNSSKAMEAVGFPLAELKFGLVQLWSLNEIMDHLTVIEN